MFEALLNEVEWTDIFSASVAYQDSLDAISAARYSDEEQDDEEEAEEAATLVALLLDDAEKTVEFEEVPHDCLRCNLIGQNACLLNLKHLYLKYLVKVGVHLEFLQEGIKDAIQCKKLRLHEGKYANVSDICGMLHTFLVKVRTERKRFYSKCRDAYSRDTWTGFIGEMKPMGWSEFPIPSHLRYLEEHRRDAYFRPGQLLSFEDYKWQQEHMHHPQFLMIGWKLETLDRLLHDKVVRPLKRDHCRDEDQSQMDFENFENSLRLACEAFTGRRLQELAIEAEKMRSFKFMDFNYFMDDEHDD